MSYLNQITGYRNDLLGTRSIIKKNEYALIEPDGIVKNAIPGFEQCEITILSSPKLGASFVDYLVHIQKDGGNKLGYGEEGVETLFYVFHGEVKVWTDKGEEGTLTDGGYIYCKPGTKLFLENSKENTAKCLMYKRRYEPIEGYEAETVVSNVNEIPWVAYEGMEDVLVKDLLPSATNLGYDMNFHILSFKIGANHGYIETHVQEHGAFIYSGEGIYNLNNEWIPVKKGDYIFMGAYTPQAAYAIGRDEEFAYIYSKDCNRDVSI